MSYIAVDFLQFVYAAVLLTIAVVILRAYLSSGREDVTLGYFMITFFLLGLYHSVRASSFFVVLLGNMALFSSFMRWAYTVSFAVLCLSSAYISMVATHLYWSEYRRIVFILLCIWGFVAVIGLVVTPFYPVYVAGGAVAMNAPTLPVVLVGTQLWMGYGLASYVFIRAALFEHLPIRLRIRAWLLALGIVISVVTGVLHTVLYGFVWLALLVDLLNLSGRILVGYAVMMKSGHDEVS